MLIPKALSVGADSADEEVQMLSVVEARQAAGGGRDSALECDGTSLNSRNDRLKI